MNWKKLTADKSLQEKSVSIDEVDGVLQKARKAIKAAGILLEKNFEESAFKEAYDSMILASRALIFALGFKPRSVGAHSITILFCELYFGEEFSGLINKSKRLFPKQRTLCSARPTARPAQHADRQQPAKSGSVGLQINKIPRQKSGGFFI